VSSIDTKRSVIDLVVFWLCSYDRSVIDLVVFWLCSYDGPEICPYPYKDCKGCEYLRLEEERD